MKKLAAILLALAMLFTLAACGEKDNDSDPNLGRYEGTTIEGMGVTMNLSDIYEGENLPQGKKSVAISLTFQPIEQTFTDKDIENLMNKAIVEVGKKTGGELR